MNGTTTPEAQVQSALRKVEEAIADLGYPRINPESLTALRDALDEDDDGVGNTFRVWFPVPGAMGSAAL